MVFAAVHEAMKGYVCESRSCLRGREACRVASAMIQCMPHHVRVYMSVQIKVCVLVYKQGSAGRARHARNPRCGAEHSRDRAKHRLRGGVCLNSTPRRASASGCARPTRLVRGGVVRDSEFIAANSIRHDLGQVPVGDIGAYCFGGAIYHIYQDMCRLSPPLDLWARAQDPQCASGGWRQSFGRRAFLLSPQSGSVELLSQNGRSATHKASSPAPSGNNGRVCEYPSAEIRE